MTLENCACRLGLAIGSAHGGKATALPDCIPWLCCLSAPGFSVFAIWIFLRDY
jgi:hypothetical protein